MTYKLVFKGGTTYIDTSGVAWWK